MIRQTEKSRTERSSQLETQIPRRSGLFEHDGSFALLLLLLNILFFADVLFSDKTFFIRDVSFFHYPLKYLVTEAYADGQWPLWNPYVQLGQPLLANPNAMAFYPSQILFHLFSFQLAFELHFVVHCILAAIAAFYLARELGLSRSGSFFTAVLYNFNGTTLSFLNLFNILPAVAFLPLLPLLLIKILKRQSILRMALGSLGFGSFFLLLDPLSSISAALFLLPVVAGVYWHLPQPRLGVWKALALVFVVVVSGLLLASVQVLPTRELVEYSGRKGGMSLEVVTFWSMHPVNLLQLVFPRIFGDYFSLSQPEHWSSFLFENREPYLYSCYFGLFPLLLAAWGLFRGDKPWRSWILGGLLIVAMTLAFGKYADLYSWLYEHMILFRYGRFTVKYWLVATLCLSLLAGSGLDKVAGLMGSTRTERRRKYLVLLRALSVLFLAFLVALSFEGVWRTFPFWDVDQGGLRITHGDKILKIDKALLHPAFRHIQLHALVFVALIVFVMFKSVKAAVIRSAIIAVILLDLLTNNFWINPLIPSDLYAEPAPVAEFIQARIKETGELARVYTFQEEDLSKHPKILGTSDSIAWVSVFRKLTLFPFLAAKDHIHFSVFVPIDRLETFPSQIIYRELEHLQTTDAKLELLAGLSVGWILSLEPINSPFVVPEGLFQINSRQPLRLYRLVNRLPRAFLIDGQKHQQGDSFSFHEYLSSGTTDAGTSSSQEVANKSNRGVRILSYSPTRIEIEATSDRPRLLVLLDSFYPGWKAMIDGRETAVQSVNHVYRAVNFPSGRHRVVFDYKSASFEQGLAVSLATATCWCVTLMVNFLVARRRNVVSRRGDS